jgi:UDP-N-acetyl-D-galactosamine dehydrogenase
MKTYKIAVIGQGYVGLPSLEFAGHYPVFGFDINTLRVDQLNNGQDITLEADLDKLNEGLKKYNESNGTLGYKATSQLSEISEANVFIVTVPTPIDKYNAPDLNPLISASKMLVKLSKKEILSFMNLRYSLGVLRKNVYRYLKNIQDLSLMKTFCRIFSGKN